MMYEQDERSTEICEQEKLLRSILSGGGTVLLAEEGDRLVGFLEAARGAFRRNRHVVGLVVGVLGDHSGSGIGTALMEEAERWARGHEVKRMELHPVMTHNQAAVALYEKAGFTIEGTRACSILVDGVYVDEHYMAKLLI